jgi:mediator of RNA polymerase II transcription subunit 15
MQQQFQAVVQQQQQQLQQQQQQQQHLIKLHHQNQQQVPDSPVPTPGLPALVLDPWNMHWPQCWVQGPKTSPPLQTS